MSIGDFTAQADAYHRSRPSYPEAMLDALAERLQVSRGDAVAELGAGTGIFTRQLAERGFSVAAVEPNDAMRAYATAHENVTWHKGTFEATDLAAGSARWIVAAQAFHWADPPRALPELARVLAPGASLTILFNDRDHTATPLMTFVRQAITDVVPDFDEAYRDRDWAAVLTEGGHFGRVWTHCRAARGADGPRAVRQPVARAQPAQQHRRAGWVCAICEACGGVPRRRGRGDCAGRLPVSGVDG